jgi:hypothetical protein
MRSAAVLLSNLRSSARASADARKPRRREADACRRRRRLLQRMQGAVGARKRTERPLRRRERPPRRAPVTGFAGMSVH